MRRLRDGAQDRDAGFTLLELIIASALLMALMAMAGSTVVGASSASKQARVGHDLNEEGRNALNRMAREIRQASAITYVVNPDGPAYNANALTAMSLRADFNGDGCAGNAPLCPGTDNATNPESLTYCFDPQGTGAARTYLWLIPTGLTAAPTSCELAGSLPILAGNVGRLFIQYRSNEYRYDLSPSDGVTTWRELDAASPPIGDAGGPDGDINTNAIKNVNSVVLNLRMQKAGQRQDYVIQVDVRNKL